MRLFSTAAWLYYLFVGALTATLPQQVKVWKSPSSFSNIAALSCRQDVIFTLDENCQISLSPQQVLLGGDDATNWARLQVLVNDSNPFNRNIADGAGRHAYLVRDIITGSIVCQSTLITEDKRPPSVQAIDWARDTLDWLCFDLDSIYNIPASWQKTNYKYYTGRVVFKDNCNGVLVDLKVNDRLVLGDCDSTFFAKIYRNFSAEDASGNRKDTTQVIVFWRPDWKKLHFPKDTAIHSCIPEVIRTPILYPFWINAVGDTTIFDREYCGLSIERQVSEVLICRRGRKVIQSLKLFDWCAGSIVHIDTTLMKIGDLQAPVITKPSKPIEVSTQPMSCSAALPVSPDQLQRLYQIGFSDCDAVQLSVKVKSYVARPSVGDSVWLEKVYPTSNGVMNNLPVGKHRLLLYANDPCLNTRLDSVELRVKDKIAPQVRCDNAINVSVSNGYGRLTVIDVDEGSSDNCQLQSLKVRREVSTACTMAFDQNGNGKLDTADALTLENGVFYTLPAERIDFFCCDIGAKVRVELIALDVAGNSSKCWLDVPVEDKTLLQCVVPADTNILCTDKNLGNLSLFGVGKVLNDPCGLLSIVSLPALDKLDNCGVGTITRRWQVVRNLGKANEQRSPECIQVIRVLAIRDYAIRFPKDTSVNCQQIPPGNNLIHQENGCNVLAFSVNDVKFSSTGQECYKILRTWTIINWCEYKEGNQPVILDRDYDGDGERGNTAFWLLVQPNDTTYIDQDQVINNTIPNDKGHWTNSIERPLLQSRGIWEYTQLIKVYDDEAPKITLLSSSFFDARNNDCTGDVNYLFSIAENCNSQDLKVEALYDEKADGKIDRTLKLVGTYPRYRIQERLPIGIHKIQINASDGCGNIGRETIQIEVRDVKGPAPICINGLVVELMPLPVPKDIDGDGDPDPGAAVVWAKDFVASKVEDCSGIVAYSIHRADEIESGREKPDPNHISLTLTCDDRPSILVYVYAWDTRGNYGYCETYVLVQDNRGLCPRVGSASISGTIKTFTNKPLNNANVQLSGVQDVTTLSNKSGQFSFEQLRENNDYTVTPSLNTNHLDGVSTYDIVLITRHILGSMPFDSPYKFIAADVDLSGFVSTYDIIQIRKVVLRLDLEFKKCPSWRFVDASFQFKDPQNPLLETIPEVRNYNNLNSEMLGADFVAVKMGDVSGNAAKENVNPSPELRNTAERTLQTGALPAEIKAGELYTIPLNLFEANELIGAQFSLHFNSEFLTFQNIEYRDAGMESIGLSDLERGLIRVSWLNTSKKTGQLATLEFRAKKSGNSSELFQLVELDLAAEAYTHGGEFEKIVLERNLQSESIQPQFQLYPNSPNPFSQSTTIEFDLGEAGPATLQISDLSGRVLKSISQEYPAGHQQIVIDKTDLNQVGVLLYTLQAGAHRKTMKMVVY
ncbi:MAG: T9SS type A sorting domain-containing protein [Haliscomenobacter sp.]|uniref:T9SS type A sorting domain-containing protein n=1 Tax=Haliscomenobacter sp. TaxID=2717303 RepID=UPI0029A4DCFC|nr:T9SS type A sorting domain-containing protein [Haliscomenobacter sp.]MDX2071119.1 T9SS type A sorting domain-containing protein [Haliscomenobacter sp.]